jgi:hypothetical protein
MKLPMSPVPAVKNRPVAAGLIAACALCLTLVGCGSGGVTQSAAARQSPAARLCKPQARQLVARTVAVPTARIITVPGTGNNAEPQCSFRARLSRGRRFTVTVNVDPSPQPYTVLSRTIVEGQQVFSPTRLTPAPVAVLHLGLLASWFPGPSHLMSTDGVRLVTTTVTWPRAKQGQEIRLATRLSRLYLGKSKGSLAHGYPAGG